MVQSKSIHAYTDAREFLDRALDQTRGCSTVFTLKSRAEWWKFRCLSLIGLDRKNNGKIYKKLDPLYYKSVWDILDLSVAADEFGRWLVTAIKEEFSSTTKAFMNKAIAHKKGCKVTFSTEEDAEEFRRVLYMRRTMDRKQNAKIWDKDEALHNASDWDCLRFFVKKRGEKWQVLAIHDITIYVEEGVTFIDHN